MSDKFQRLLDELQAVENDMGIYPAAVKGWGEERDYRQRDGYKNGWNAAVMEYVAKCGECVDRAKEGWSGPEQVFSLANGESFWREEDGWSVFLNDAWYFATADMEPIPTEEYETVAKWFKDFGDAGVCYWVYQKRGHLPQNPRILRRVRAVESVIQADEEEAKRRKEARS